MTASVDIDPIKLSGILDELFPNIQFSIQYADDSSGWLGKTEIYTLIRENNIDINNEPEIFVKKMIDDKKYTFAALFPKDAENEWDELKTKIVAGDCNIFNFFLGKIDGKFIEGYNTVVQKEIKLIDSPVVNNFNNEVFSEGTLAPGELNDPKTLQICMHSTDSFYKTFEYYAHKQYTLIRLGREFPIEDLHKQWNEILKAKMKDENKSNKYRALNEYYENFLNDYERVYSETRKHKTDIAFAMEIIRKLFIESLKIVHKLLTANKRTKIYDIRSVFIYNVMTKIDEILESTPKNFSSYAPTDFITLTGQISRQLGPLSRKITNPQKYAAFSNFEVFSTGELQKINSWGNKLFGNANESDVKQIEEVFIYGNTFDKIKLLYDKIHDPSYKFISKQSREEIAGLYNRIMTSPMSLLKKDDSSDALSDNRVTEQGDNRYLDFDETIVIISDREKFAYKFLSPEFNADDEKYFIEFIAKEGNWMQIIDELNKYYNGYDKQLIKRLLFTEYCDGRKNADYRLHTKFSLKIVKVLKKYKEEINDQ